MKSTQELNWQRIWEKKGNLKSDTKEAIHIWDLVGCNGYDSGADRISKHDWDHWIATLTNEIAEHSTFDSWLDIGCGAGAFLFSIDRQIKRYGSDYSQSLIQIARRYAKQEKLDADFYLDDLNDMEVLLHIDADIISCVSALQYVPVAVGLECFKQMLHHARKGVLIAEIPSLLCKEAASDFRANSLTYREVEEYPHSYYSMAQFNSLAINMGYTIIKIESKLGLQSRYRWSAYYHRAK